MIRRLGSYSVGAIFPTLSGLLAHLFAQVRGRLTGALRASGTIDAGVSLPSVSARVNALTRIAASVALQPPAVRFNAAANVAVIADAQAALAVIGRFRAAFGAAGIEAYEYEGTAAAFGSEVAAETAGGLPGGLPSDQVRAIVLVARYPDSFEALRTIILP